MIQITVKICGQQYMMKVLGRNRSGKQSMSFVIYREVITDDRIIAESFHRMFLEHRWKTGQ